MTDRKAVLVKQTQAPKKSDAKRAFIMGTLSTRAHPVAYPKAVDIMVIIPQQWCKRTLHAFMPDSVSGSLAMMSIGGSPDTRLRGK